MVRIQGATVIARSVEDVFDFVADERNEPMYNSRMVRAEKITSGPIAKGTRWLATVESRGRPLDMKLEVTDTPMTPSTGWTSDASSTTAPG
jgi:hypothetical protein